MKLERDGSLEIIDCVVAVVVSVVSEEMSVFFFAILIFGWLF